MIAERASDLIRFGSYLDYNKISQQQQPIVNTLFPYSGHDDTQYRAEDYYNNNKLLQQQQLEESANVWSIYNDTIMKTNEDDDSHLILDTGQQKIYLPSLLYRRNTLEALVDHNNNEEAIMMMMNKNGLT